MRRPPGSTLFPTTTLFRSRDGKEKDEGARAPGGAAEARRLPRRPHRIAEEAELRAAEDLPRPPDQRHGSDRLHPGDRSEEHTSELQSRQYLVCRLLLDKNT